MNKIIFWEGWKVKLNFLYQYIDQYISFGLSNATKLLKSAASMAGRYAEPPRVASGTLLPAHTAA